MELDRKELKCRAREAMGLAKPRFWVVTLVYLLITTGVSLLLDQLSIPADASSGSFLLFVFLSILFFLYSTVINFGYDLWSLWTYRRWDPGLGSLIQGFSVAGRVILMELSIILRMVGWAFCLSFVCILLAVVIPILTLPCIAALYAAIWAILLRYALAPYLLADHPDDGVNTAVRRSAELMRGWKWELFKLEFSFLGWILLSVALPGIATALVLWSSGFFQAIAAYNPAEFSELIQHFLLWQSGSFFGDFPADQIQLFQLYDGAMNSTLSTVLSNVIVLPLSLWLLPYRSVARAGFYDIRLQLQREGPQMPPL